MSRKAKQFLLEQDYVLETEYEMSFIMTVSEIEELLDMYEIYLDEMNLLSDDDLEDD